VDKKLMLQYESWRNSEAELKSERKRKTAQQRAEQEKEELQKRQEKCAGAILKEVNILKCLGDTIQVAQLRASRLKAHEDEKMRMSPAEITM
jgi:hypothetical protein